jgi:outer membrane protein
MKTNAVLFTFYLLTSVNVNAAVPTPISSAVSATSSDTGLPEVVSPAAQGNPQLTLDNKDGQALSLEESIKIAIRAATEVLKAENDLSYNGARLLQAYGQFLPNLQGAASDSYSTGVLYSTFATPAYINGSSQNATYTITASLNIFNGLADFSNLKSSILKKDAADLTLSRAKQSISLDVAQSFLQVILDNKIVDIAKKTLQASQERERLLQEQSDVGTANLSDLFRQQAQASMDEASLYSDQNKTRTDQISLLRKLRLDVRPIYHFVEPPLQPNSTLEKTIPQEKVLIDRALESRMDLKASNNIADASNWEVKVALSSYFPKLDLLGGISSGAHYLNNQTVNSLNVVPPSQTDLGTQLGQQVQYSVGLSLSWSLFDRFVTHLNTSRARAIADNSAIDAQDRKFQVEGDVRQAYGDYLTAVQQLRTSKKGQDAAQKAYEVMDGRYEVGSASFLDLITAQAVLVQAESNRAQALINFQLQDRKLAFAVGDLKVE